MTGKRSCFAGCTFHHTAVAGDDENFVGEEIGFIQTGAGGEVTVGDRHTDCGSKTAAEGTGGDIDTVGVTEFRMSGSQAAPLTEVFQFFHIQTVVEKVQQAVDQH